MTRAAFSQIRLALLLLLDLEQQSPVDAGQDTTEGDSCTDKGVQFFITTDGQLEVARRDTLDLKILGGVACQFKNFGGQVFQHCCDVDGSFGADAHLVLSLRLEETLHTTAGEL